MKKIVVTVAICAITSGAANGQAIKVNSDGDVRINQELWVEERTLINGDLYAGGSIYFGGNWCGTTLHMHETAYPGLPCPHGDWYGWYDIYTSVNNNLRIGHYNRANSIYSYLIDYQTLVQTSDIRLKENVRPCTSLLSKLKEVKSYNYNYTDEYFRDFTIAQKQKAQKTEYGFLAQELQEMFPELVHESDSGILGINYVGMIPILTASINEMQKEIETRDSVIDAILQKIESLEKALIACRNNGSRKNMQEFNLNQTDDANDEKLKVFQNVPNPFNENTIITCYIPENIQKVELCVYDMHGGLLKCLTIQERSTTSVQIQAGQLAAGIYTYILIGDGKSSEAKQMILTK